MSNKTSEVNSNDAINPSHYSDHPSGIEAIQIIKWMDLCLGNAMKYIWRAGKKDKDKEIEDLEKAIWYINCKIEMLKEGGGLSEKPVKKLIRTLEKVDSALKKEEMSKNRKLLSGFISNHSFYGCDRNGKMIYINKNTNKHFTVEKNTNLYNLIISECSCRPLRKMHKNALDVYYDLVKVLENGDLIYKGKESGYKIIVKVHIREESGMIVYIDYD